MEKIKKTKRLRKMTRPHTIRKYNPDSELENEIEKTNAPHLLTALRKLARIAYFYYLEKKNMGLNRH